MSNEFLGLMPTFDVELINLRKKETNLDTLKGILMALVMEGREAGIRIIEPNSDTRALVMQDLGLYRKLYFPTDEIRRKIADPTPPDLEYWYNLSKIYYQIANKYPLLLKAGETAIIPDDYSGSIFYPPDKIFLPSEGDYHNYLSLNNKNNNPNILTIAGHQFITQSNPYEIWEQKSNLNINPPAISRWLKNCVLISVSYYGGEFLKGLNIFNSTHFTSENLGLWLNFVLNNNKKDPITLFAAYPINNNSLFPIHPDLLETFANLFDILSSQSNLTLQKKESIRATFFNELYDSYDRLQIPIT